MSNAMNSQKGFTLIEAMIGLVILMAAGFAVTLMSTNINSGLKNSKAQGGVDSLRSALSSTLADPAVCTTKLNRAGVVFNPNTADVNGTGSNGFPLTVTLQDGTATVPSTVVNGNATSYLVPNFSVQINGLNFQMKGTTPVQTNSGVNLVDPSPNPPGSTLCDSNNVVYAGDVSLAVQKQNTLGLATSGGVGFNNELVGTLMLTVETAGAHKGAICRCYAPDPCTSIGGSYNPNGFPSCSVCPTGKTWVGNNATGVPICLPNCTAPGQFLVSQGGGTVICRGPSAGVPCGPADVSASHGTCNITAPSTAPGLSQTGVCSMSPTVTCTAKCGGPSWDPSPQPSCPSISCAGGGTLDAGVWVGAACGVHGRALPPTCINFVGDEVTGTCPATLSAGQYCQDVSESEECRFGYNYAHLWKCCVP